MAILSLYSVVSAWIKNKQQRHPLLPLLLRVCCMFVPIIGYASYGARTTDEQIVDKAIARFVDQLKE